MGRPKPEANATTWQDVMEAIPAWEAEHRVEVVIELRFRPALASGGFVEVVLYRREGIGRGPELVRMRGDFPARKGSGHAGAVMYLVFRALLEYERNPWLWSDDERKRARGEA